MIQTCPTHSASMEPEPTPAAPQHASSNSNSPPPIDDKAKLNEFLSRPTPKVSRPATAPASFKSGPEMAALLSGEDPKSAARAFINSAINAAAAAKPPPPPPNPFTAILPLVIGAVAFMFGSGFGVGWLMHGWWNKPSSGPKGTAENSELNKLVD